MVSMDTGMRHEHMVPRLDLLGRNINSIVGNLWQRQEEHGSSDSNGNLSPGSGESGPESPQHHDKTDDSGRRTNDDDAPNTDRSGGSSTENGGSGGGGGDMKPSIGIRSDLLPLNPRDLMDAAGGLPALEALRRQAAAGGAQNPFLAHNSPLGGLSLTTTKRPSQPPTPQSSTSGGDPASAWSFEEQFKQLYEIDDNPKRKDFLDDLFAFMQKRGSPINRLPIMAKQVLDLYELYNLVVARGGLVEVINKKQWQEIIKGLGLPSSITSAAFTLRTQYTKYLYPLEASQHNFSNNADLQNAIDGNKREGRRLAPYGDLPTSLGQSSPVLAAAAAGHHRFPQSPTQSPPHHPSDPLAQLEMTRLALWKLYSQGQAPPPPPPHHHHGLMPLPPALDLNLHRQQQEQLLEHQKELLRADEERRREEARRRITAAAEDEPAEKRARRANPSESNAEETEVDPPRAMEEDDEEEEEPELEVTRAPPRPETTISLTSSSAASATASGSGNSMKISMEVNGILYSGVLYATKSS